MKKKHLLLCLLLALALVTFAACGQSPAEEQQGQQEQSEQQEQQEGAAAEAIPLDATIVALKGPTGIGMVKMMDEAAADPALAADFRVAASPDEIVAALGSGEAQLAAIPTNLAAKLYRKLEGDLVLLAINTYGNLYLLENGDTVHEIADLAGRTLYATGQGANPQYVLEYLLRQNGLEPGRDVEIIWRAEHAELATMMASGDVELALLPEPNVTSVLMKNTDVRIALDLNQIWQDSTDSRLTMGCVVAQRSYAEENPAAVQAFLSRLQASIQFAVDDPAAAALCETYGVIPSAALAEAAIPNCNLTFLCGEELEPALTPYLQVLLEADPAAVGGALPDGDFYYIP